MQRLYDQWEEDDDPIPVDELPDHDPRKPRPSVDFSKLDMSDPESVIRATKKGQTLMMFVKVKKVLLADLAKLFFLLTMQAQKRVTASVLTQICDPCTCQLVAHLSLRWDVRRGVHAVFMIALLCTYVSI